jgi:hypothetical protein
MDLTNIIVILCQKIRPYNIPRIRFRKLDTRYKLIYEKEYHLHENDINKASFMIFLISFIVLFSTSNFFSMFNLVQKLSFSLLFSLFFSYSFNKKFYKEISRKENQLNAFVSVIRIYFSLIQKSVGNSADLSINFIKLISDYNLPIKNEFRKILNKVQLGQNPEILLSNVITPSVDFNSYLKELLMSNFTYNENLPENSLEKKFQQYLREIESKLSVFFFVGLFFPLGICFLILFQKINFILLVIVLPLFFISIKALNKKFLKNDSFLLGLLNNYSKEEKAKFHELISFLKGFALNLQKNSSPEIAFINSYSQNKSQIVLLGRVIKTQITNLLNFSCSFEEMLENLQIEINSIRYKIILEAIGKLVSKNAYISHKKINELINEISKHQILESKLDVIIRGEKFRVLFFLFLLPVVIGGIGGLFPLFNIMISNISFSSNIYVSSLLELFFSYDFVVIFLALWFCVYISSYYFLEIISYERKGVLITTSCIIYLIAFFSSFFSVFNYF